MSALTDPLRWVQVAEKDYSLALSAVRRKRPLTYGACFHAQQCAEKYLKAALVSRGQIFPKVHDLVALHGLCQQAGLLLGLDEDDLDVLTSYAVQVRYPGEPPTHEEAKQALRTCKKVRMLVREFLSM
jgi:HEPN domain-containing protein